MEFVNSVDLGKVWPPLATSAPQVAAAEVKVDPPARYFSARVPGVRSWRTQMERWMVLWNYPVDKYVAVVANQMEGAAQA